MHSLRRALRSRFPGATIRLARFSPGGRVSGSLIWEGFDLKAQIDRQLLLREAIQKLPPDDQSKVSFILTLTPEEHESLAHA
jgi:hypothetical protein